MSAKPKVVVAVVGEDRVHHALAVALFDAILLELPDVRKARLKDAASVRDWAPVVAGPADALFYDSHRDDPLPGPRHRENRARGYIHGKPVQPGAAKLRRLYLLHAYQPQPPDLVVILQDTDNDPRLLDGAAQVAALAKDDWERASPTRKPPRLVIGLPHRDAEGWFFAAPVPADAAARLQTAKKVLNFDPSVQPERLTSRPNHAPADAKRVVRFVLLNDGSTIGEGTPASRPPDPDEAAELAGRVASDLKRLSSFEKCNMAPFIRELRAAVGDVFASQLPPA